MGYVIFHFGSLYFGDEVQNVEQNQGRDRKPVSYDGLSDISSEEQLPWRPSIGSSPVG